jgi:uncharacterized membrane protein required for colicin V production
MLNVATSALNIKLMMALSIESLSPDKLPVGWFDFVFAALLVFGLFRGRKNGLTKELIPTLRWIAVVLAAGLGYKFAGQIFYNFSGMGRVSSDCLGYVAVAFLVCMVFIPVDGLFKTRLEGSNLFGGSEYYLGALFGLIRSSCIILFFLALMNAPHYTAAEIQAQKNFAAQTFGGGEKGFDGNFFPTFQQVQEGVFKKSLVGPFIKDHLGMILINSVPAVADKTPAKSH